MYLEGSTSLELIRPDGREQFALTELEYAKSTSLTQTLLIDAHPKRRGTQLSADHRFWLPNKRFGS